MARYVILSRLSETALSDPDDFNQLAEKVAQHVEQDCPDVKWKESYATLGRFDIVDIVEAEDPKQVERAAMIIRSYGHAHTETMLATPWKEFRNSFSR
jgi:uncharacterized protein with GYD domain